MTARGRFHFTTYGKHGTDTPTPRPVLPYVPKPQAPTAYGTALKSLRYNGNVPVATPVPLPKQLVRPPVTANTLSLRYNGVVPAYLQVPQKLVAMSTDMKDGFIPNPELYGITHNADLIYDLKGNPSLKLKQDSDTVQAFFKDYLGQMSDTEASAMTSKLFESASRYDSVSKTFKKTKVMKMNPDIPPEYLDAWNYIAYVDKAKSYQKDVAAKTYIDRANSFSDYNDPDQINSAADVVRHTWNDVTQKGDLLSGFKNYWSYAKNVYLDPIANKSAMAFGINALIDFGETLDAITFAKPVRAALLPYEELSNPKSRNYFQSSLSPSEQSRLLSAYDVEGLLTNTHGSHTLGTNTKARRDAETILRMKSDGVYDDYLRYTKELEEHKQELDKKLGGRFFKGITNGDNYSANTGIGAKDVFMEMVMDPTLFASGLGGATKTTIKGAVKLNTMTVVERLIDAGALSESKKVANFYTKQINQIVKKLGPELMSASPERLKEVIGSTVKRWDSKAVGVVKTHPSGASMSDVVEKELINHFSALRNDKAYAVFQAAKFMTDASDKINSAGIKTVFAVPYLTYKGVKWGTKKMEFIKNATFKPILDKYKFKDGTKGTSITHFYDIYNDFKDVSSVVTSRVDTLTDFVNSKISKMMLDGMKIDAAKVTQKLSEAVVTNKNDANAMKQAVDKVIADTTEGRYKTIEEYRSYLENLTNDMNGLVPEFTLLHKGTQQVEEAIGATLNISHLEEMKRANDILQGAFKQGLKVPEENPEKIFIKECFDKVDITNIAEILTEIATHSDRSYTAEMLYKVSDQLKEDSIGLFTDFKTSPIEVGSSIEEYSRAHISVKSQLTQMDALLKKQYGPDMTIRKYVALWDQINLPATNPLLKNILEDIAPHFMRIKQMLALYDGLLSTIKLLKSVARTAKITGKASQDMYATRQMLNKRIRSIATSDPNFNLSKYFDNKSPDDIVAKLTDKPRSLTSPRQHLYLTESDEKLKLRFKNKELQVIKKNRRQVIKDTKVMLAKLREVTQGSGNEALLHYLDKVEEIFASNLPDRKLLQTMNSLFKSAKDGFGYITPHNKVVYKAQTEVEQFAQKTYHSFIDTVLNLGVTVRDPQKYVDKIYNKESKISSLDLKNQAKKEVVEITDEAINTYGELLANNKKYNKRTFIRKFFIKPTNDSIDLLIHNVELQKDLTVNATMHIHLDYVIEQLSAIKENIDDLFHPIEGMKELNALELYKSVIREVTKIEELVEMGHTLEKEIKDEETIVSKINIEGRSAFEIRDLKENGVVYTDGRKAIEKDNLHYQSEYTPSHSLPLRETAKPLRDVFDDSPIYKVIDTFKKMSVPTAQDKDLLDFGMGGTWMRFKGLNFQTAKSFIFGKEMVNLVNDAVLGTGPIAKRFKEIDSAKAAVPSSDTQINQFIVAKTVEEQLARVQHYHRLADALQEITGTEEFAYDILDVMGSYYHMDSTYFRNPIGTMMNELVNKLKLKLYAEHNVTSLSLDNFRQMLFDKDSEFWSAFKPDDYEQCKGLIDKLIESGHVSPLQDVRLQEFMIRVRGANGADGKAVFQLGNLQTAKYDALVADGKTVYVSDIETSTLNANIGMVTSVAYKKWVPLESDALSLKEVLEHCMRNEDIYERRVKLDRRLETSYPNANAIEMYPGQNRSERSGNWKELHTTADRQDVFEEKDLLEEVWNKTGMPTNSDNVYWVHHNMNNFDAAFFNKRLRAASDLEGSGSSLSLKHVMNSLEEMKPEGARIDTDVEAKIAEAIAEFAGNISGNMTLFEHNDFINNLRKLFPEYESRLADPESELGTTLTPIFDSINNLQTLSNAMHDANKLMRCTLTLEPRSLKIKDFPNEFLMKYFTPAELNDYAINVANNPVANKVYLENKWNKVFQDRYMEDALKNADFADEEIIRIMSENPNTMRWIQLTLGHKQMGYAKELEWSKVAQQFDITDLKLSLEGIYILKTLLRKISTETDYKIKSIECLRPYRRSLSTMVDVLKEDLKLQPFVSEEADILSRMLQPEDEATLYVMARELYQYYNSEGRTLDKWLESHATSEMVDLVAQMHMIYRDDAFMFDSAVHQTNRELIGPINLLDGDGLKTNRLINDVKDSKYRCEKLNDVVDDQRALNGKTFAISASVDICLDPLEKYKLLPMTHQALFQDIEREVQLKQQELLYDAMLDQWADPDKLISHLLYNGHLILSKNGNSSSINKKLLKLVEDISAMHGVRPVVKENKKLGHILIGLPNFSKIKYSSETQLLSLDGKEYVKYNEVHVLPDYAKFTGKLSQNRIDRIAQQYGIPKRNMTLIENQDFDFADIAEPMMKAHEEIRAMSEFESDGSLGTVLTAKHVQEYMNALPTEFTSKVLTADFLSEGIFWRGPRFDKTIYGIGEARFGLFGPKNAAYKTGLISNFYAIRNIAARVENEVLYANMFFNRKNMLGVADFFKGASQQEIVDELQKHPEYTVVSITGRDKQIRDPHAEGYVTKIVPGYQIFKHEIQDTKDIEMALQADAIVVPKFIYETTFQELNKNNVSGPFLARWSRIVHAYKTGYLFSPGTWVRNYMDSTIKAMMANGDPLGTLGYQVQGLKKMTQYNQVLQDIYTFSPGSRHIDTYNLDGYYRMMGNKVALSKDEFLTLHGIITGFGNESDVLQKQFRHIDKVAKRQYALKDAEGNIRLGVKDPAKGMDADMLTSLYSKVKAPPMAFSRFMEIRKYSEARFVKLGEVERKAYADTTNAILDKKVWEDAPVHDKINDVYNMMVDTMLSPMSFTERVVRLGHYLDMEANGYTANEIFSSISDTHFNYMMKSNAMRTSELLIPFAFFEKNNLEFWLKAIDDNPVAINMFEKIMGETSWDFNETDVDDYKYNMSLQAAMLNGTTTLDMATGWTLKLNPSAMSALGWWYNTPNAFIEKTITPVRQVMIDSIANYGAGIPNLFDPNLFWSANPTDEWYKSLLTWNNVPIFGPLVIRYSQMAPKYAQRLRDAGEQDPSIVTTNQNGQFRSSESGGSLSLLTAMVLPDLFGALSVTPSTVKFESFASFQDNLKEQGRVYDANTGKTVDLDELSKGGLNDFFFEGFKSDDKEAKALLFEQLKDVMLEYKQKVWDANVQDFVPIGEIRLGGLNKDYNLDDGDWPQLCSDMKKYLGKVWDANQRTFVKDGNQLPGMLNTKGLSWEQVVYYRDKLFDEKWDANFGEFVPAEEYSGDVGLNQKNLTWDEVVYYKRLLQDMVWDDTSQQFVPATDKATSASVTQKYKTGTFGGYKITGAPMIPTTDVGGTKFATTSKKYKSSSVAGVVTPLYQNDYGVQTNYYNYATYKSIRRMQGRTNSLINQLRYRRFVPLEKIHNVTTLDTRQRLAKINNEFRIWR